MAFNMIREWTHRLNYSIFYIFIVFHCFLLCSSLYEDQIGKFDWRQQYVGHVKFGYFEQAGQTGRRFIVGTDQNVVAGLSVRNGQIVWRQIMESDVAGEAHMDDMLYSGSRIFTVTNGGSHVRCWSTGQGELNWDVSLPAKSGKRAKMAILSKTDRVAVLTGDQLTGLSIESGKQAWATKLPDSSSVFYKFVHASGDRVRVLGYVPNSHFVSFTVTDNGVSSPQLTIPAAWASHETSCQFTGAGSFVCANTLTHSLHVLESSDSTAFATQLLQDLGLSSENPHLVSLGQAGSSSNRQDMAVVLSSNHMAIIRVKGAAVSLVKDLPGVSAVQQLTFSGRDVLLAVSAVRRDVVEVKGYDADSGSEMTDIAKKFTYADHHGIPEQIYGLLFKRKDGGVGMRAILVNEDHSVVMVQHTGAISWTREEALSSVVAVEMLDLPVSENQAKMEDEFGSQEDDIMAMFLKRISTQLSQVKISILHLKHKLRAVKQHHTVDDSEVEEEEEEDEDYMTRDDFNLHKMVVLATSGGKIFGVDSLKGRIIWQHYLPNLSAFQRFGRQSLALLMQRTTAHFPHTPQCALLGKHKKSGNGLLYVFNPITGQPVESPEGMHLDYGVLQVALLAQNDDQFLKGLLILGTDLKYHTYPASVTSLVRELAPSVFFFTGDVDTGVLQGYGIVEKGQDLLAREVWTVNLQRGTQTITNVVMKRAAEHVHSQGLVMGDRSVLYKYLNPNLVVVTTEGVDSQLKAFLNLYLIDAVSGQVVFHCTHKRSKGPVHVVHSENWVVYDYWNQKNRRTEIVVMDLYEGKKQSNATTFSSLHPPPPPLVMRQSYIFSGHMSTAAVTITEKGITSKHVLVALKTGGILELPKMFLDSRRPVIYTAEHREEGLMPYIPELPRPYEHIINYNHSVYNIRGIHTAPAGLESTSLVMAYGLDLFFTRVTPSRMFDVIKEDFDYFFISSVLIGMTLLSVLTQKLAARKALNRAWR